MEKQRKNKTTIRISDKIWKKLNSLKKNPKETYEDVLNRLLKFKTDEVKK